MKLQFLVWAVASSFLAGCAQLPAPVKGGYVMRHNSVKTTPRIAQRMAPKLTPKTLNTDEVIPVEMASTSVYQQPVQTSASESLEEPLEDGPQIVEHPVIATDTGFKLARTYHTSVERILKDNGLASVADIREGQVLRIASNSKPQVSAWDDMKRVLTAQRPQPIQAQAEQVAQAPVASSAGTTTQVAIADIPPRLLLESKGNSSGDIQSRTDNKIEPKVLARAAAPAVDNKLAEIEPAAGERPAKTNEGVGYENYTVQAKDTIYRISLKYNVSVLDIMAANDFEQPQDLKANAVIRVPVKKSIIQQLAAKVDTPEANVALAAGEDKAQVIVEQAGQPVQVAMLSKAPAGAKEAQAEDLETKAVKQQAQKDAALPVLKDKPVSKDDAKHAEEMRGQIDKSAANARGLVWPVKGQILKKFGDDGSGIARTGINIAVPKNTPVLASEAGMVLYADDGLKIYGKMVLVRHDNGMVSAYAHNGYLLVKKNERVKKGQVIALSGATGNVEIPQLHFELRQHASAIDPIAMLPRL